MAFPKKSESENKKQHINLSKRAFGVLEYDKLCFNAETTSGLLNRIFKHYAPRANASVSLRLNRYRGALQQTLQTLKGINNNDIDRVVTALLLRKKEQLLKGITAENGVKLKFWLDNENFAYLTQPKTECHEERYYSTRGKYIKAVIEEYTALPFVERERIYFKDTVSVIDSAVAGNRQLRVVTATNKILSVHPYALMQNSLSTANYLVGYTKRYDSPEDKLKAGSFRISSLASVRMEASKKSEISTTEKSEMKKLIAQRGVEFMVSRDQSVKVHFTELGVDKYHKLVTNRPAISESLGDNVYLFQCTASQAEYYFFKFGKDAKILAPIWLKNKFATMYEEAALLYSGKEEENGD